ncbi:MULTISPECIES: SurA N-terminal domain-containing protein [Chryseobacterium]|uniref:Periplasmic chaperone PpiD n=1 Tax=Chryseobacterium camelliae TaxID=1265445 RepID=A0ABU0TLS6_9FLAO|nr:MULTISPECIES: peptidylprolyl isomerase [Chryseobacterium]MDT3408136.1 peptidyl-prolyl cis-trans isomerase D [Pseudacidovorax intermedius]MDQ1098009.1 peptidyl-prolyl cis-trans isomerase D [Chryseobacterium camelliae]MDQ1101937.1 peptidyl-prolyl cis-trans isomerase D [Chryseobacterium sp. SORGH_AS_1048]MDR6085377.1 peptidyl-prolyl cis-trans isomerase D [Chryseobacterium sp. SORGH_AS_0909]MDR6129737.1 peptidyl-prolyl cis-trans isomerase D [Chryseobacterium sp. SORGH_AS_1175]
MAILGQIRNRPWLLMGVIALALLAFLVNPDSIDKVFGKNPDVLGKVNGDKITREEFNDQLFVLQQQAEQQGQPKNGLEEQAWQLLVQSKLIKQQFEKLGFEMTDDYFWNQIQYDQMFAQNKQLFDEKGNFKTQELKKQIEDIKATNPEAYNQWLKTRKSIEYRLMARQVFANVSTGITTGKKEAEELMKERDQLADIDFVKIDYATYLQKNNIKVTTADLADYIKQHPVMFKTEASRNLGIVYFPSKPSAADDAAAQKEITKLFSGGTDASGGKENFQNTTNDSLFVMANSDMPFTNQYFKPDQLPQTIQGPITTAAIGQTFGPYKEQNFYVVSKLIDKKTSDSTLSRHILIAFKGSPAGEGVTRTKEQAKKLADSIGAIVKANPARFTEFLKLSSDPNSAAQGGSLGWTTPETPFVPEFLHYLANNPKGATGVVETQYGYHVINIEDKKPGAMAYKVANLVKAVKPSDATEADTDKKARRFIQQVQGKSFNDFVNIAKKGNYQFSNPKSAKRFDGQLQGLGTDKDAEILAWAFDKKRSKGDTEFFTVDGTGDKIVVYLNGIQEKGTADPESVRDQIEVIVKNKLAAKQISEKINAAKASNLDQIAKLFSVTKQSAQVNLLNPSVAGAMEPKVAGAAFGVAKGKLSKPVEGGTGVYVVLKKNETVNKQPGDLKQFTETITQRNAGMFGQAWLKSLQDNADIKDYRIEIWNKLGSQQQ